MPVSLAVIATVVVVGGTLGFWFTRRLQSNGNIEPGEGAQDQEPLTGLCRAGFFRERLRYARDRAIRYDTGFSILLIEIEGLPDYQVQHGAPAASALIKQVADAARRQLHRGDLISRCCEGEMAVLLTDSNLDRSRVVASEMGNALGKLTIPRAHPTEAVDIAVVVGLAHYPDDGQDPVQLMKTAHSALARSRTARFQENALLS